MIRLSQSEPPVREVRNVFLTHLHSDHTVGLVDVWLTGWLNGQAKTPFRVWGPRGTKEMMHYLDKAFNYDIRIRLYDDRLQPEGVVIETEDIEEGVIYENGGVKVTSIEVDHSPIYPAIGYKVEYNGKTVVLSGDTRFSEHFIAAAQGADVLIHEVIGADIMRKNASPNSEVMERVIAHHTTSEEAGVVFSRIQPRLAVFSHIIPITVSPEEITAPTRKTYKGLLEAGEDLMVIEVGDKITVIRKKERNP